jgi:tungstate transport system substrate-binding protein
MKKWFLIVVVALLLVAAGCTSDDKNGEKAIKEKKKDQIDQKNTTPPSQLIITSTTSTVDSGFFDFFLPKFEKKYNVKVVVLKAGTGEALKAASRGEADVVFTHSEKSEAPYVADGTMVNYKRVMFNDFVLVGPKSNPADIVKTEAAKDAFQKLFSTQSKFVSRNDASGTHTKELDLWKLINTSLPSATPALAAIPAGDIKKDFDLYRGANDYYIRANTGMGDCLLLANQRGAYCLTDRGTWLNFKVNEGVKDLAILNEGDKVYKNIYHVAMVNPEKFTQVKKVQAQQFIDYILGPEGQKMIRDYKINGENAFYTYLD